MPRKGKKSKGGEGDDYNEPKSVKLSLQITQTARDGLDAVAEELGLSISEINERIGRRILKLSPTSVTPQPPFIDQEAVRAAKPIKDLIKDELNSRHLPPSRLARKADMSTARLKELMNGDPPEDGDLIALSMVLQKEVGQLWSLAELRAIRDRTFKRNGNSSGSVGNGI
jgi:hypothetical protein